jgi:putative membrane protein
MKLKFMTTSKLLLAATGIFMVLSPAYAQMGGGSGAGSNPYDTGVDSPFLRKKPTPAPSASAAAATKKAPQLSTKDSKFLSSAIALGAWDIKTGSAVESKLQNPAVKSLASRLVADYTKSNAELTELAKKKGLGISADTVKAQQIPGPDHDKNYLKLLSQDSQEQISTFQKEASSGDDPEVKSYAAKLLPTVRQHSAAIRDAESKVK